MQCSIGDEGSRKEEMIDLNDVVKKRIISKPAGIVEEKYMLIITRYPNGKTFPRIFPISAEIRSANKKRKPTQKKEMKKVVLDEKEVY